VRYDYRVIAVGNKFVAQQFLPWLGCLCWVGLDEDGRVPKYIIFETKNDAQKAINKAKDINGEWYPEWL
jgi:hypothetical protein